MPRFVIERRILAYALTAMIVLGLVAVLLYVGYAPKTVGFIRGTVTIGPVYPGPCREGVPCYEPYRDFHVNVYDKTGTVVVTSTVTDAQGTYQITVPTGQYLIYTKYTRIGGLTGGAPVQISVLTNQVTMVDIDVDTGLR